MIKIDNGYGTEYKFEIVNTVPVGYQIWNIGRSNFPFEKMIPLCECSKDYRINPETLLADECKTEEIALKLLKEAGRRTVNKTEIDDAN